MRPPVGLLLDTIYDNTGDKAIRMVMEEFLQQRGLAHEVLDPLQFDPRRYSRLVIGGGHLIRDVDGGYYDAFRVSGPHILNTAGVLASKDLDYLREYDYVSVRSQTDKHRLERVRNDIAVVPCVSLLMSPAKTERSVGAGAIGLQFDGTALAACPGLERVLSTYDLGEHLFIPFTHYNGDRDAMAPLSAALGRSELLPYLEPGELLTVVGRLRYFVSSSLHGCIFAYAQHVPFLAFDNGAGKLREFCTDRGLEQWVFRNTEELNTKLGQLVQSPPDSSPRVREDMQQVRDHLQRLEALLAPHASLAITPANTMGAGRPEQSRPSEEPLGSEEPAALRTYIDRLHQAIQQRDFHTASRFQQLETSLTGLRAQLGDVQRRYEATRAQLNEAQTGYEALKARLEEAQSRYGAMSTHLDELQSRHQTVTSSVSFRLLERLWKAMDVLAPRDSRRQALLTDIAQGIDALLTRGWKTLPPRHSKSAILSALRDPGPQWSSPPGESLPDVEASQWWTRDTIAEYQSRRLRWMVCYLWDEIPFYREWMRKHHVRPTTIQGIDDLAALPPVNRALLRENFDRIVNKAEVVAYAFTGGTTGERFRWAYSASWGELFERCLWRGFGWAGLSPNKRLLTWGIGSQSQLCETQLRLGRAFDIERIEEDLQRVLEFQPEAAYCTPSLAFTVAKYLAQTERTLPVQTMVSTAEPLFPEYRAAIEAAFSCQVYDNYGCNEGGSWGAQCGQRQGFHHDFERNVIEFVDGRMVATDLWNTGFPFLRYENGDVGNWLGGTCACGRQSPRFAINGRTSDLIVTPRRVLTPSAINAPLQYEGLNDARLIQHSATEVEVLLVKNGSFTRQGFRAAQIWLAELLGQEMQLQYRFVDEIPSALSGKHRVSVNLSGIQPDSVWLRPGTVEGAR